MSHEPTTPTTPVPPLPPSVRIDTGQGDLPVVRVTGRAASAEVYLHGAHVTHWAPTGHTPVLWMSGESEYLPDEPLRGGVPICFPWFGAHPTMTDAPAHGFARRVDWELADAHEEGDDVVLTFVLADSEVTHASAWPYRFVARYTVTVGATLTLALEVTNLDTVDVTVEEALHTYLAVQDIRATEVSGLEGARFLDRLAGPDVLAGEPGPVVFRAETDRIYLGTSETASVRDMTSARTIAIAKSGSRSTVVWNPWADKAAAMADFGDDEWTGMVCVETCNIRDDSVRLEPGESHTMRAVLSVVARTA